MQCLLAVMLLLTPLVVDSAIRLNGEWRGKAQNVDKSTADKTTSTAAPLPPVLRRVPSYVETSFFRKAPTTTTETQPEYSSEMPEEVPAKLEVEMLPAARLPPIWRPSLLGEQLIGSLLRHTATDEFERSHGQYVDSFIHGQPLGFF